MPNLLRISEAASIAFHSMAMLAAAKDRWLTRRSISEALKVSESHLTKVLQRLSKLGFVRSERGPHGGFSLARPAEEIRLIEIYEAIDGSLSSEACLFGNRPRCLGDACVFGELLTAVNRQGRKYLTSTTLAEVARSVGDRLLSLALPVRSQSAEPSE